MLDCADLDASLARFKGCTATQDGLRIATDCLLPSFEQVHVYVVKFGDGLIVHDDCAAARSAWVHGVDDVTIAKDVAAVAKAFSCKAESNQISLGVPDPAWLWSAVASVANASAEAARRSVGKARKAPEQTLFLRAFRAIEKGTLGASVVRDFSYAGDSGRQYGFDIGVVLGDAVALVDVVSAHPTSVAFKHMAFSDVRVGPQGEKYIVHGGDLPSTDRVLLSNVADLITITDAKEREGWNVFA
jgi:hypothetical protein